MALSELHFHIFIAQVNRTEEPTRYLLSALRGHTGHTMQSGAQRPRRKGRSSGGKSVDSPGFCQRVSAKPSSPEILSSTKSRIHMQMIIKETLMSERQDFHILEQICS